MTSLPHPVSTPAVTPPRRGRRLAWALAGLLWLGVVGSGLWFFERENFTPGAAGEPSADWPAASRLARRPDRPSLVVALHPECSCSAATVHELGRIIEKAGQDLDVIVVMVQYENLPVRVEDSALWRQAAAIPGVRLVVDPRGEESRRFDARTSGETRLYDARGRLLFHGGITASRGHEGDNPGERAVLAFLSAGRPPDATPSAPVFGCAL